MSKTEEPSPQSNTVGIEPQTSRASNDASNQPVLRLADFGIQSRDVINFIHIPKNAGTSFKALCGTSLQYRNHSVDVQSPYINKQLVILRDPVERFVSAFYYSLEYYRHRPHVRDLYYHHIVTPNRMIELLSDPTHPYHPKVQLLMANDGSQRIGPHVSPHKWIYSPQALYVHNPTYVMLFENLASEWVVFSKHHQLDLPPLPNTNTTKKRQNEDLTPESIQFIHSFYAKDCSLIAHYRSIPLEERIRGLNIYSYDEGQRK